MLWTLYVHVQHFCTHFFIIFRERVQKVEKHKRCLIMHVACTSGWQKLAAFRRGQKWPQNLRQARNYYFRDTRIVFANLIQYFMRCIPCNNALIAHINTVFHPKIALLCPTSSKKCVNCDNSLNIATK